MKDNKKIPSADDFFDKTNTEDLDSVNAYHFFKNKGAEEIWQLIQSDLSVTSWSESFMHMADKALTFYLVIILEIIRENYNLLKSDPEFSLLLEVCFYNINERQHLLNQKNLHHSLIGLLNISPEVTNYLASNDYYELINLINKKSDDRDLSG
jgi:hypothetical protein